MVDGKFLLEKPTSEYLATPGLIDRFNLMVGCTTGEVAMGAAAVRTKSAFERIMGLLFRFLIPVEQSPGNLRSDESQIWQ